MIREPFRNSTTTVAFAASVYYVATIVEQSLDFERTSAVLRSQHDHRHWLQSFERLVTDLSLQRSEALVFI